MQTITSTPKLSLAGTSLVQITDGSGNLNTLSVESVNMNIQRISGAVLAATNALPSRLTDGTGFYDARQIRALTASDVVSAAQSGTWNITNISGTISLPTGASTSALQTTGNTSLSSIDTKTPTIGQKTMVNSSPVVIASDQSEYPIKQGTAAALSGGWPVKVTDGTNVQPTGDVAARAIFTKTTDGTNTQAVEATPTFASVGASLIHYLIQQGLYFFGQDYATGIGNGATRDVLIITGSTKTAHARFAFATLSGTYLIYEAPTTTANGTAITIRNRNRTSANTASATMFSAPTVTATGTLLASIYCASNNKSSDWLTTDDEIVLTANTKYLIRFTSAAGSNVSSLFFNFYEV